MEGKKIKEIGEFLYDCDSEPIGRGMFGKVFKGCHKDNTNDVVAIKVIEAQKVNSSEKFLKLLLDEIKVLQNVQSKHIIRFRDAIKTSSGNMYIVTDLCEGGTLEQLLARDSDGLSLPIPKALKIVKEIATAFMDLRQNQLENTKGEKLVLIHRDIKPANVFFHKGRTILGDFGFSKFISDVPDQIKSAKSFVGTPSYMPPQALSDDECSYKFDIWSTGIVLYEMLFRELPWVCRSTEDLKQKIMNQPLNLPNTMPTDVKDLLSRMLALDEKERIDWQDIVSHSAMSVKDSPVTDGITQSGPVHSSIRILNSTFQNNANIVKSTSSARKIRVIENYKY